MAIEEMFTELPTVSNSTLGDIICAVQGYVSSPLNLGLSTQQTLQQVYNLFQSNLILSYAGNPNGFVAGTAYQLLWDTTDLILWVCTSTGTAGTAVWQECISSSSNWFQATSSPVNIADNGRYVCDNGASLVTFNLPITASFGEQFEISGMSTGGWTIAQNSGQSINLGSSSTTVGVAGSLSSTNRYDYVKAVCVVADTTWNIIGSMGNITIV